ncbi:NAD(P)-binding domain-containing protein [uncultured Agrobacterium sp.]|uniref:NADPH-dependent F420 reductase n=1 Tax=uncultured Agrobacterium sp. TaxID=157277 RepID=UPI0025ED3F1C|nr:NAD(P)-binding domain-containing protein [uncultured Agrobacterium sp.]
MIKTPSTIAILGAGRVATSLASGFAKSGHQIIIGVRDAGHPASWSGPEVRFATHPDAIAAADVVFNATPGDSSVDRLGAMADALAGKLLVDVANATGRDERGAPSGMLYFNDSLAERLQSALPLTRVVKTLNTMLAPVMSNPAMVLGSPAVYLSGNDADAKATVRALLIEMGWVDTQILDLGSIETARGPEAVILLATDVMKVTGFKPFAISPVS